MLYFVVIILSVTGSIGVNASHFEKTLVKNVLPVGVPPAPDEDIVGIWKLNLDCFDHNGNRVLDDDELKKGIPNNYILQLNADGTCKLQQVFSGRYEIKTENGRKMLRVYRKKVEGEEDKDPLPDVYEIKSVKKDELILLVIDAMGPTSFWIFKRVK